MEEPASGISTSRRSYTQLAEYFSQLLTFINTVDSYNPNEKGLQKESLEKLLTDMHNATAKVDQTEAMLNTALRSRNQMLYAGNTGLWLYSVVQNVKKYVKSVYGSGSDEYSKVSRISFNTVS